MGNDLTGTSSFKKDNSNLVCVYFTSNWGLTASPGGRHVLRLIRSLSKVKIKVIFAFRKWGPVWWGRSRQVPVTLHTLRSGPRPLGQMLFEAEDQFKVDLISMATSQAQELGKPQQKLLGCISMIS